MAAPQPADEVRGGMAANDIRIMPVMSENTGERLPRFDESM